MAKIESKLLVSFAFIFLTSCSNDYMKLYRSNSELLNETGFILTSDYEAIINSDTCNRKKQTTYYIKKNNLLSCNQSVTPELIENLSELFETNFIIAIYGNSDFIEFYTKRETNFGITTIYYFAYFENPAYYSRLQEDSNAQIFKINSKWLYVIYENDE